jgi:hypothetical protein
MNIKFNNFIGVFDDVFPEGYCAHVIKEFDRLVEGGAGFNRIQTDESARHEKNDMQLEMSFPGLTLEGFNQKSLVPRFFDGLQVCYEKYIEQFSVLRNGNVRATAMKVQRTDPGGGYHIWHAEQGPGYQANRTVAYMLYLNSIAPEDGAETEFLYQKKRFNPTENLMVMWPAAYTHAHRGNPVLGETHKYIITGWFYYD